MILTGDPRGGTTWLAEKLKQLPKTTLLWEPLALKQVTEFRKLGFIWRQYIPEEEEWREAKLIFDKLFSAKILSPYLCQATSFDELLNAEHLIIKFCRANQLLPWLTSHYDFLYPPLYLVRHPCAVIASQLTKGAWRHLSPVYTAENGRFQNIVLEKHGDFLKTINSLEQRLAATWCLSNLVVLNHSDNNKRWMTLTYESLLLDYERQIKRIQKRWGVYFPENSAENIASRTTHHHSPMVNGRVKEQLTYWKTQLSKNQIKDIFRVLDYFELSVYSEQELPHQSYD
jgi:hypothetical protein